MNGFDQKSLLVVDDNLVDVELLKIAFLKAGWRNPIVTRLDGEDAIEYLSGLLDSAGGSLHELPIAILTDLKMPRGDGFDLLEWIGNQPALEHVVRVMVTNSKIDSDKERAFKLGVNFYLTKPARFDDFVMFAANFLAWLRLNRHPVVQSIPRARAAV